MNLSEIIKAVEDKNIPESIEDKTEWISILVEHSKKVTPISACLIFSAKENNFRADESGWMNWAMKKFQFASKSYVHQCRHVGNLLLGSNERMFKKLVCLSFGKLYELSDLKEQLSAFLEKHDIEKMSRDEIRKAADEFLGKTVKEKKKKSKFWEAVKVIAETGTPEIYTALKEAGEEDFKNGRQAACALTAACIEKWKSYPDEELDPQYLKKMEMFLREQIKDVVEMKLRSAAATCRRDAPLLSAHTTGNDLIETKKTA